MLIFGATLIKTGQFILDWGNVGYGKPLKLLMDMEISNLAIAVGTSLRIDLPIQPLTSSLMV